ncbi:MAG TPA: amidohydrolase, partial [Clostridiaceae bacterium]|nr:amidohydrolase [Clostridiaceae bacterium]
AVDTFTLRFIGRGSHGAHPEQSRDPIVAAAQFVTALQSIKSRNIKASDMAVITIGKIEGGISQNIIPETVELLGTVRSFTPEVRDKIESRIKQMIEGISMAMDVKSELDFQRNYPAVVNDEKCTRRVVSSLAKVLDSSELNQMQDPVMIGEDFACFLQKVPGTFLFLTNPKNQNGENYPHHHSRFDINEEQLTLGVTAFVQIALDFLD